MKLSMFKKTASLVAIAMTIFLVSWKSDATKDLSKISEEDLFNGLVFVKGEVAAMVPELKDAMVLQSKMVVNKQEQQQIDKLQQEIVDRIKLKHPKYLAEFKNAIISGNHYAIEAALEKADAYAANAIGDILGMDFSNLEQKKDAVKNLLGSKMAQLKELHRRFQIGEMTAAEFTTANDAVLADKKNELLAIFSNPASFNNSQLTAGNQGACIAVNLAFALNVTAYANIAVTLNIYAYTNVYWGTNYFYSYAIPRLASKSLSSKESINSIARVFKQ
jgi:SdpC family antimicrobial peptide